MSERRRDPALKSDELPIRELEEAGWSLWFSARLGDRVVAGHRLDDVIRRALAPHKDPTKKGLK